MLHSFVFNRYVLQIQHEDDYNEFMDNMVDVSNPDHTEAYEKLKKRLFGKHIS